MRSLMIVVAALALGSTPVVAAAAKGGESKMSVCAAAWRAASASVKAGTTYREYSSACMKGASPAAAKAGPDGAEAKGDAATADARPSKRARVSKAKATAPAGEGLPTAKPADATAQCRDDTYSSAKSHAGACAGHGGVASWL
ncbi:MAG: DUF3761 domain-containing protein [Caulobacteraceae bacterium]